MYALVDYVLIGSDNGLSPGHQAIIWTNAGILLIGLLGRNFNEISIEIHTFSFKKIHLKMSSGNWRLSCLGLIVLTLLFACTMQRPWQIWVSLHWTVQYNVTAIMFLKMQNSHNRCTTAHAWIQNMGLVSSNSGQLSVTGVAMSRTLFCYTKYVTRAVCTP